MLTCETFLFKLCLKILIAVTKLITNLHYACLLLIQRRHTNFFVASKEAQIFMDSGIQHDKKQ